MATTTPNIPHFLQDTTKQYNTFQIVDPNRKGSRSLDIVSKIVSFFQESSPSSSTAISTTHSYSSGNDTIKRYNDNCPSQKTYYLFYANILCCSISFTLIIPSLWSYLKELQCTELYLAFCISIYAFGELCGSYLASMIKNKHNTKFLLILSISAGIIGGFIYGTAGLLHYYYGPYAILLGRLLQGIWTGMEQYTETKYLSDNVDIKKHLNALSTISFVSSIGFVVGPLIGVMFQFININMYSVSITGNMLCGYMIMMLCTIQCMVTLCIFDNKRRMQVPKRPECIRTLSIRPRKDNNYTTPTLPLPSDTTPLKNKLHLLLNDIDYLTPPPPKLMHIHKYQKKQRRNGYEHVLNFDSASPPSSRRWLSSASPPSGYAYDYQSEISKDKINIGNRTRTHTASYLSVSENTFHRTSVAEMLNINTPSAFCTPYSPFTPRTLNGYLPSDGIMNSPKSLGNGRIKYVRTYTAFTKFAGVVMTFCFLIHFEAFSIQQTMTSYLIEHKFGWDVSFAHLLFILCGIVWMSSFYVINNLLILKSVNRYHNALVQISLVMGVVSTCCLISVTLFPDLRYNGYIYVFGFILISFTFPFGRGAVLSLYCLCTNNNYIEWIYLVSMMSRIVTPFIGVGLYFSDSMNNLMYGNVTVLFLIAIVLCSLTTSSAQRQKIPTKVNIINHGYSIINIPQVFYIAE